MNKHELYREQSGKCFFCEQEFPIEELMYDHLFPKSYGGDKNSIVLSCRPCDFRRANKLPFREIELNYFITEILNRSKNYRNVIPESRIPDSRYVADILAERKIKKEWEKVIIELKSVPTFTSKRIEDLIQQIETYTSKLGKSVKKIIAFPGILPDNDYEKLRGKGIEVWDREYIMNVFKEEIEQSENILFKKFFGVKRVSPKIEDELISTLKEIKAGRKDWSKYQKHIEKVLDYLFGEELSQPITELSDKFGINRRDFILRNYSENGFWKYLRDRYNADFIVIDAKNYTGKIKKNQVLQLSNYLKIHGTGLFSIIISRNGEEDNGAYFTRREKWITEKKLTIILDDSDIEKMILAKASANSPEEIIKQRIEEFRLEM